MKKGVWVVGLSLFLLLAGCLSALAAELEIGVAWVGKSGMADRVLAGLQKGFENQGVKAKLDLHKNLASLEDLAKVVADFQAKYQGQVLLRSNAAEWLSQNPPTIPTFIGGCNHPGALGAIKDLKAPEGKITGVTYFVPAETQFEIFKAVLPQMKSVLLLVAKGHPGSPIDQKSTQEACQKMGIAYQDAVVSNLDEAVAATKAAAGQVSAIILGVQAMLTDKAELIVAAAGDTPVLSYSEKPVSAGALAGFAANDERLGEMLAESVSQVLLQGKPIKDVPVKFDPKPVFYLNAKMAEKLGLKVPYEILENAKVIE